MQVALDSIVVIPLTQSTQSKQTEIRVGISPLEGLSADSRQTRKTADNRTEFVRGDFSMAPATYSKFIRFLLDDLAVSSSSIDLALRHREDSCDPLAMILWQYGLISLEQLDRIFDWLETA
jgi:hypothetical protein